VERGTVRVKCLVQEHNTMLLVKLEPGLLNLESRAVTTRPSHLHMFITIILMLLNDVATEIIQLFNFQDP